MRDHLQNVDPSSWSDCTQEAKVRNRSRRGGGCARLAAVRPLVPALERRPLERANARTRQARRSTGDWIARREPGLPIASIGQSRDLCRPRERETRRTCARSDNDVANSLRHLVTRAVNVDRGHVGVIATPNASGRCRGVPRNERARTQKSLMPARN